MTVRFEAKAEPHCSRSAWAAVGAVAVLAGIVSAGGPIAGAPWRWVGWRPLVAQSELGFCRHRRRRLLPFATLPFDIGLTPTFLDFALGAAVLVWLMGIVTGRQRDLVTAPVLVPLLLFIIVAIFAFIFGLANGPLTPTLLRKFAELLLSLGFVLVVIDTCRTWPRLERLVKFLLLMGGAAALAIGLWLLPDATANNALNAWPASATRRLGDPLHRENPELSERPSALGRSQLAAGLLMIGADRARWSRSAPLPPPAVLLIAGLVVGPYPDLRGRCWGWPPGWASCPDALPAAAAVAGRSAAAALLPITQAYIARFVEGFQGTDLATQMRFGEYKDALILIGRYPIFGVGFAGAPDVDVYLAVASVYFTIAGRMGLFGLLAFFGVVGAVFAYAFRHGRVPPLFVVGFSAVLERKSAPL
jgi:hypothetical protein